MFKQQHNLSDRSRRELGASMTHPCAIGFSYETPKGTGLEDWKT